MSEPKIDYKQLGKAAKTVESSDVSNLETLTHDIAQYKQDIKEYKEDVRHVNSIMVAGVIVLLVMVATLMAMLLINYINSYENYTNMMYQQGNNYQLLQQRVNDLENKIK